MRMEKILLEKAEGSFVDTYSLLLDWDCKKISLSEKSIVLLYQIVYDWLEKLPVLYDEEVCPEMKADYRDFQALIIAYSDNFAFYFAEYRDKMMSYIQAWQDKSMSSKDKAALDLFIKEVVEKN